jgi:hypothetical protein
MSTLTELRHRFIRKRSDAALNHAAVMHELYTDLLNGIEDIEEAERVADSIFGPKPTAGPAVVKPIPGLIPTPATTPKPEPAPEPLTDPGLPVATTHPPEPPAGRERDALLLCLAERVLQHGADACSAVVDDRVTLLKGRRTTTLTKWLEILDAHDWETEIPEVIEDETRADELARLRENEANRGREE